MSDTPTKSVIDQPARPKTNSTWLLACLGSLLLFLAFPPVGLGPLAWFAPVPWVWLIMRENLQGNRPYRKIWLAGFLFWLLILQWIRLAHPALYLGWVALAAYLACYLPLFIGLARVAVHRLKVPVWIAAPVVWTGLELVRAHFLTGFLLAPLSHTQVGNLSGQLELLQISDVLGSYGVSFVIMLVASAIAYCVRNKGANKWQFVGPLGIAAATLAVSIIYGYGKIHQENVTTAGPRVALIQGNSLPDSKGNFERDRQTMLNYARLTSLAVERAKQTGNGKPLDLFIWPETMFRTPLYSFDDACEIPDDWNKESWERAAKLDLTAIIKKVGVAGLIGIDRVHYSPPKSTNKNTIPQLSHFNSTILTDEQGSILGTYDKMHRVMFGEYIPLADSIPWLYEMTPLTGGIRPGNEPAAFEHRDVSYVPNICYESVMPHVIRNQVVELNEQGKRADVLVNLTNDAWYWGSSALDLHLACSVFRAIECRTPVVAAANGGLTASIDSNGRIVAQLPRQTNEVLIADVKLDERTSLYIKHGDWFAGICLLCCIALAIKGMLDRKKPS